MSVPRIRAFVEQHESRPLQAPGGIHNEDGNVFGPPPDQARIARGRFLENAEQDGFFSAAGPSRKVRPLLGGHVDAAPAPETAKAIASDTTPQPTVDRPAHDYPTTNLAGLDELPKDGAWTEGSCPSGCSGSRVRSGFTSRIPRPSKSPVVPTQKSDRW